MTTPRGHLNWHHGLLGAIVPVALLIASPVLGGTIRLDTTVECTTGVETVRCEMEMAQSGDEAASALELTADLNGRRMAIGALDQLAPGESWQAAIELPISELDQGTTALFVETSYEDAEGYPLSALSHALIEISTGEPPVAPAIVEGRLETARLTRAPSSSTLELTNRSDRPLVGSLRLILPRELDGTAPSAPIELAADSASAIEIELVNRFAFEGGSYRFYAQFEAIDGGERISLTVPGTAAIVAAARPTERFLIPLLLIALGTACAALWFHSRSPGGPATRVQRHWPLLADLLGLGLVSAFLLTYLRPELLLSGTTATGGDMASHVLTFEQLRTTLLPAGRLLGWMPGNLAGYPIFQLYFPLPFLAMLPLTPWVGPAAAFKLGTVLGTLALPTAAYLAMRLLGFGRPTPLLAAAATLPFLFIESNSVWGGNLASTLAGEFAYSLAMALTILFLGTVHRGMLTGRWRALNAVLLAAIGLSHAYALLVAGTLSACALLWSRRRRRALAYLSSVWTIAFCLIGFWVIPLLVYNEYTSPYRDVWAIDSWQVALPPILWPLALLALLGATDFVRRQRHRLSPPAALLPILALAAVALAFYRIAPRLGVVDIRFLPFAQLSLALLAAVPVGRFLARTQGRAALVPFALVAVFFWVDQHVRYLPQWIDWNYSGFESRPLWPAFSEVNRHLAGSADDPRVVFEHSPAHNAAGSIRAFESLPLFSGRSTLEGLYIQSGLMTPEIFYLQSELSPVASCPLPEFHCARLDVERAADHLKLFNVSHVVARSDEVKRALTESAQFDLERRVAPFDLFTLRDAESSYVVPLSYQPIPVTGDHWRETFFHWFKAATSDDPILIRAEGAADGQSYTQRDIRAGLAPRIPIDGASVNATVVLSEDEIVLRTDRPGHPLLIRVAYHPRWRASGESRVRLAAPGFLLVEPAESEVRLHFGAPPLVRAGQGLTGLGLLLLMLSIRGRRRWATIAEPRLTHIAVLALVVVAAGATGAGDFAPELFDRGMEHYNSDRLSEADLLFDRAIAAGPISSAALHSTFYRGLIAYRGENWSLASQRFEAMIDLFPESPYRPEAEYHIALSRQMLGQTSVARQTLEHLMSEFPGTPWAGYAAERLEAWS